MSTGVHYLKPSIAASPSTEISVGQDWTLHCWAPFSGVSFVFYQARDFRYEVTPQGNSNMAEFSLKNVSKTDEGRYTCYYHSLTDPVIWSNASNPVVLKVLGEERQEGYILPKLNHNLIPALFSLLLIHTHT
uniref:Ig-like domain-containing protein n=1 Tax=Naja naja TaxID=35670 RepID=A0A8C6X536_NAJNA